MPQKFFADIGSSTAKLYSYNGAQVELVDENSLQFKYSFTPETGIAADKIELLIKHFNSLKGKYSLSPANFRSVATGIWREIPKDQLEQVKAKFAALNLPFEVISHELEAHYSKLATRFNANSKKMMIINMGGKTTEVLTVSPDGSEKAQLLQIGAADLTAAFLPRVNQPHSGASIEEMEAHVAAAIKDVAFDMDYDFALYMGELRAQTLVGYSMRPNVLFSDPNHPYMETFEDFVAGARKMFFEMTYAELEALTPHNPKWWVGGRAGAVLPLAIFRKAGIKWIVPSELNLAHGAVKEIFG